MIVDINFGTLNFECTTIFIRRYMMEKDPEKSEDVCEGYRKCPIRQFSPNDDACCSCIKKTSEMKINEKSNNKLRS